mgnify:CR=1 FL=1
MGSSVQVNMNLDVLYYYTISWDGISDDTEGSVTFTSKDKEDAIKNIHNYLDYYKDRNAYLSGFSMQNDDYSENLLTDDLKNKLGRQKK